MHPFITEMPTVLRFVGYTAGVLIIFLLGCIAVYMITRSICDAYNDSRKRNQKENPHAPSR